MDFDHPDALGFPEFCPNAGLGFEGNPLLNAYINDFTFRAEFFGPQFAAHGLLKTFWIWNEPNVRSVVVGENCPPTDGSLAPEVFAAMVFQGCTRIKASVPDAVTYVGSLSFVPGLTDPGAVAEYLRRMYQTLRNSGITFPFPWDALSVNIEGFPNETDVTNLRGAMRHVQDQFGDTSPIILGEWGVRNQEFDPDRFTATYHVLRQRFPKMYFYDHGLDDGFGVTNFQIQNNQFVPANHLALFTRVQTLLQTT